MKKSAQKTRVLIIGAILLSMLLMLFCSSCGGESGGSGVSSKYETLLQGKWIWKAYETNPIYRYLEFNGKSVRFGTNLYGSDLESATWTCQYAVKNGSLILTKTDDETEFVFTLQESANSIRIFDENGNEYIKQ